MTELVYDERRSVSASLIAFDLLKKFGQNFLYEIILIL